MLGGFVIVCTEVASDFEGTREEALKEVWLRPRTEFQYTTHKSDSPHIRVRTKHKG